jgi:hypothetical protein
MKLFGHPPIARNVALVTIGIAVVVAAGAAELVTILVRRSLTRPGGPLPGEPDPARATARVVRLVAWVLLTLLSSPGARPGRRTASTGIRLSTLVSWLFSSGLKVILIAATAFVPCVPSESRRIASSSICRRAILVSPITPSGARWRVDPQCIDRRHRAGGDLHPEGMDPRHRRGHRRRYRRPAIGFGAQTLVKDVISGFF